jgi:hypothetical protein
MYREYKKQVPLTMMRVTDERHLDDYSRLMTLWRVAEHADGVQSLVLSCFKTTGIWGVKHETWEDLCAALHISRATADRRSHEGDVARRLLSGDPFLRAITSQIRALSCESSQKIDCLLKRDETPPISAELLHVSSPHAAIARDSKLLRIIHKASPGKWVDIATEAARNGPATRESVKAAVLKIAPESKKPKIEPKVKREPKLAPLLNALADAAYHFQRVLKMPFAEQVGCVKGIKSYTDRINKEVRKIGA